jgi:ATP-binding cassette subfamily F protein uup
VLLVSHDRRFLDEVVTQTLAAEGDGTWREYVGGYSEWLEQRPAPRPSPLPSPGPRPEAASARPKAVQAAPTKPAAKLSYREARELEQLPSRIEALEKEQHELTARMSAADYHAQGPERIRADRLRSEAIDHELEAAFARWAEIDARFTAHKQG